MERAPERGIFSDKYKSRETFAQADLEELDDDELNVLQKGIKNEIASRESEIQRIEAILKTRQSGKK